MSPRPPLWRVPAGPFFLLAALAALALPWLWALPLPEMPSGMLPGMPSGMLSGPRQAHLRLGFFAFAGSAVCGYVLTALPAWGPHRPLAGPHMLAGLFLLGRLLALTFPARVLQAAALSATVGLLILLPALRDGRPSRLPIAAAPLALAGLKVAITLGPLPAEAVPWALAALILLVGGRAVPAFLATEVARHGRRLPVPGPLWLPFLLAPATLLAGRLPVPALPLTAGPGALSPALVAAGALLTGVALLWLSLHATEARRAWLLAGLAGAAIALAPASVLVAEAGLPSPALPIAAAALPIGAALLWLALRTAGGRRARLLAGGGGALAALGGAGLGAAAASPLALAAGLLQGGTILWRVRHAAGGGPASPMLANPMLANLMLAGAWGSLALTLPLLLLARGPALLAAQHLFLIATMGGTIFAFSARAAMARPASGGLHPRRAQVAGLALVLAAGPLRALAVAVPDPWLTLSALCWSGGWLLNLAAHLAALRHPAPYPVLGGARGTVGTGDAG